MNGKHSNNWILVDKVFKAKLNEGETVHNNKLSLSQIVPINVHPLYVQESVLPSDNVNKMSAKYKPDLFAYNS